MSKFRRMRQKGRVARMGKPTNAYRSLAGKPLGWKDKIKTSLKK
jgi:hypothetical protein